MRLGTIFAVLVLLSASACGGSDTSQPQTGPNVTIVEPSSPLGTVWGAVLQAGTHDPLEGAEVVLSAGEEIRITEADEIGMFSFTEVPAGGEVGLSISASGYSKASLRVRVPGEAGDFPAENIGAFAGPVALFPLDGETAVQLIGHDGQPVGGASARARASAAWIDLDGGLTQRGFVTSSATSDAGNLAFGGLPNLMDLAQYGGEVSFIIEPVYGSDGSLKYLGHSETHAAADLVTRGRTTVTLAPPGEDAPLQAIATNVGSLLSSNGTPRPGDSVIGINEAIRVVFNQPLDPATLEVAVYDHDGEEIHPTLSRIDDGNVLRIAPDGETYTPGRGYRILLTVQALGTSSSAHRITMHGSFFATPPEQEVKVLGVRMVDENDSGSLDAGDSVYIDLSQSIGLGNGAQGYSFPVYLNLDLSGSSTVGDALGELGSGLPIWATAVEPQPPAPMRASGFTRHFVFEMPNVPPADNGDPEDPRPPYSYGSGVGVPFRIDLGSSHPNYERLMAPTGKLVRTPADLETVTVGF